MQLFELRCPGHYAPVFLVIDAAPVKKIPIHLKTEPATGNVYDTNPFVYDFLSDLSISSGLYQFIVLCSFN